MSYIVWILFVAFIILLLAVDLGLLKKGEKATSLKSASIWVLFCVFLALSFGIFVYFVYENKLFGLVSNLDGSTAFQQYLTAWLLEQSLGLDNVFVFALIFSFFKIPPKYQHRVLFWGVMGALVLRGIMIALGASFLENFWWAEYLFAVMLLYAAFKMAFLDEESFNPSTNPLYRLARRVYPVSDNLDGENFFTRLPDGRRAITPLFLVLLVVESSDVLFAFDSIPAVFGVTSEPFLVFTSNIFAILNLRSLYFMLSSMLDKFHYLKMALIVVLLFIALKMLLHAVLPIGTTTSMLVVISCLGLGVVVSLIKPKV
jgi:tellurite resistance protein TerC